MSRAVAALALVLLVGACAKRAPESIDPSLPEQVTLAPDVEPHQVLVEAAAHVDPTPRAVALAWLIRLDPEPAGGAWGARTLYDPSAWVQQAGVDALVDRIEEPEAQALLEEYVALGQADPYTRGLAGIALAEVGSTAARDTLAAAWRAEREAWIVAPLALGSAAFGDPEAIDAVAKALQSGEIGLELAFLRAVGASGHHQLQQALREGAGYVEEELELPFAVALVQLGDPSGEQRLRKALQHDDPEVRMGAVDLLVDLDHPTATALLQKAKNDSTSLVRWYARLALAARTESDLDTFDKAWEDEDPEVRELALRFVARAAADPATRAGRKLGRTAERLIALGLVDDKSVVRLAATRAAQHLALRTLAEEVAAGTRDPWPELRVESAGVALALGFTPP